MQKGDAFDIATLMCSVLVGSGYDAYVINGRADLQTAKNISLQQSCPFAKRINILRSAELEKGSAAKLQEDLASLGLMAASPEAEAVSNITKINHSPEEAANNDELSAAPTSRVRADGTLPAEGDSTVKNEIVAPAVQTESTSPVRGDGASPAAPPPPEPHLQPNAAEATASETCVAAACVHAWVLVKSNEKVRAI